MRKREHLFICYSESGRLSVRCIILDINLPNGNELKLLEHMRRHKKEEGVVIISARDSLDDKINGLNDLQTYYEKFPQLTASIKEDIFVHANRSLIDILISNIVKKNSYS